jgi:hypothetical protein
MLRVTVQSMPRRALLGCLWAAAWAQQPGRPKRPTPEEREGRLRPGDPAPDFRLKMRGAPNYVQLSSFRGGKPVAIVFGSFT